MRGAVDKRIKRGLGAEFVEEDDPILQAARVQIDEYFAGIRETFNIPLLMVGSDFQKSVWKALLEVPYGETISYLQLSQCIDNVKAIRAVAAANGANAISLIIPCHRIIGSNGDLVGYGGVLMSLGLLSAFFPWSASALAWPEEWLTILVWSILGAMLLLRYERNKTSS